MELEFLLWMIVGMIIEAVVAAVMEFMHSTRGILRIDHSDPAKDVYLLELDDLDAVNAKKYVTLKIDHNANLSQK